jgi:uncharacterized protein YodC (DUF2158 family)
MQAAEFAVGDRVRSKFYSPPMTVADVYDPAFLYRYRCVWTDAQGNPQHELFRGDDLVPADDPYPD